MTVVEKGGGETNAQLRMRVSLLYNLRLQYMIAFVLYIYLSIYFSGPGFLCGPPRFDCLKIYLMINILKEQYHEIVRLFFDWSNTLPGPLLTT